MKQNHERLEMYFKEYFEYVYLSAVQMSNHNEGLAQDATQEAFLKLFLEMSLGHDVNYVKTWLVRVAHNYMVNFFIKNDEEKLQNYGEEYLEETKHAYGIQQSAEDEFLEQLEEEITIEHVLKDILIERPQWYSITYEVCLAKKTLKQVAEESGVTPASVYSVFRKLKRWVNKKYGKSIAR